MRLGLLAILAIQACTVTQILAQEKLKIKVGGSINANMSAFENSGETERRPPFIYRLYGNPNVTINGWDLNSTFQLGSYEDRLKQRFNRAGITANKKWFSLLLGHRRMEFSEFSISDKVFLGGGIELTPGVFRFSAFYGNLNRKTKVDSTDRSFIPSFKRDGYGFKVGVGKAENFVDIHYFKASDDTTSLQYIPDYARVAPEENLVLGLVTEQKIKKYYFLSLDIAASAYTRDIRASEVNIEDQFFGDQLVYSQFQSRISSQYLSAGTAALEYRKDGKIFGLSYTRVEPEYRTMGSYFLQSDIERIQAKSSFSLLEKKLKLNLNVLQERNNVLDNKTTDNKRAIYRIMAAYTPNMKLQTTIGYSAFTSIQERNTEAFSGVILNQYTHQANWNIQIRTGEELKKSWSISSSYLNRRDRITSKSQYSNISGNLGYRFPVFKLDWSLSTTLGASYFELISGQNYRLMPGLSINGPLNKNRTLQLSASSQYTAAFNQITSGLASGTIREQVGLYFTPSMTHRFNARISHAYSFFASRLNYQEFLFDIQYTWTLRSKRKNVSPQNKSTS